MTCQAGDVKAGVTARRSWQAGTGITAILREMDPVPRSRGFHLSGVVDSVSSREPHAAGTPASRSSKPSRRRSLDQFPDLLESVVRSAVGGVRKLADGRRRLVNREQQFNQRGWCLHGLQERLLPPNGLMSKPAPGVNAIFPQKCHAVNHAACRTCRKHESS